MKHLLGILGIASVRVATFVAAILVISMVISVIAHWFQKRNLNSSGRDPSTVTQILGVSFSFSLLAFVCGYLMSGSREASVSAIIPVALTFVGGIAVFLVSKPEVDRAAVLISVISFSLMLFLGATVGGYERRDAERFLALQKYDPDVLRRYSDIEISINRYRAAFGLPPIRLVAEDSTKEE